MYTPAIVKYSLLATLVALTVVLLGAYTRLSDAGLGCPDWPGCYGHLDVPSEAHEVSRANALYPDRPVEAHKAWKEMVHRYFAGSLGLLIVGLAVWAWLTRRQPGALTALPLVLVLLVVFQALLGMWTVTLKVMPLVVMSHLLGGFATLALLWWYSLRRGRLFLPAVAAGVTRYRFPALLALLVVIAQISLGGWTSSNYAALACPDFPTCQAVWWPPMDFSEGFVLLRPTGIDYEYGVLDSAARTAIHMTHRLGALVTLLVVGLVAWRIARAADAPGYVRRTAWGVLLILGTQIALGIGNVVFSLPLGVAVAHNGVGALLLLSVVTLNHVLRPASIHG